MFLNLVRPKNKEKKKKMACLTRDNGFLYLSAEDCNDAIVT